MATNTRKRGVEMLLYLYMPIVATIWTILCWIVFIFVWPGKSDILKGIVAIVLVVSFVVCACTWLRLSILLWSLGA